MRFPAAGHPVTYPVARVYAPCSAGTHITCAQDVVRGKVCGVHTYIESNVCNNILFAREV